MSMVFGGYVVGANSGRHQLEVVADPAEIVIRDVLWSISECAGVITMRRQFECEGQPYELILHFESGNFLLMLCEYDKDGEHTVRTLTNPEPKNELITVLGEKYPARAVTRDIDLICDIFITFSVDGNVPADIMS